MILSLSFHDGEKLYQLKMHFDKVLKICLLHNMTYYGLNGLATSEGTFFAASITYMVFSVVVGCVVLGLDRLWGSRQEKHILYFICIKVQIL